MKILSTIGTIGTWLLMTASALALNLNYTTDWVGNTDPTADGYVGNCARSMWIAPEGIVYTSSIWDEKGRSIGIYQNGEAIGSMGGNVGPQGSAISGNSTSLFVALADQPGKVGRYNRTSKLRDLVFAVSAGTGDAITGIAVSGGEVYISDFPGNRIRVFSTGGTFLREWSVTEPGALAVENGGSNLWVARKATGQIRRYSSTGTTGTVINMGASARPASLHITAQNQLWVGDEGPDMNIKKYTNLGGTPTSAGTFGVTGGYLSTSGGIMGQTGDKRFTRVAGIGTDTAGNIYVLNNPWGGTWDLGRSAETDLHCYNGTGALQWTLQSLNFEGIGAPDPGTDGENLYTGKLILTGSGGAGMLANTINPFRYPSDRRIDATYGDRGMHFGHVAYVNGHRILVACGQNPDSFFSYYFNQATDGYVAIPGQIFDVSTFGRVRNGFCLDSEGNVWTSLDKTYAIQKYPLNGFAANGAPIWGTPVSTPTPSSIARLNRIEYLPESDTMILGGGNDDWVLLGNRIEVYNGWEAGNRTPNTVITLNRAQAKAMSAAGDYLFVGYYAVPNVDVFDLATGQLALTLVSNNDVTVGNDTDSMYGIKAYRKTTGEYMICKDDYNRNKVVIYRWNPDIEITGFGVADGINPNEHVLVEATFDANTYQAGAATFDAAVGAAYAQGMGGVVDFDGAGEELDSGPSIVAAFGANKTLTIGLTSGSALAACPFEPTSGLAAALNCVSAPEDGTNRGDITFTIGNLTGGQTGEKVVAFSFTYLTQSVLNGLTVTVTAQFSDGSSSVVTRTIDRSTTGPTKDTFFAFVAPVGASVTSVSLVSNTTRSATTHIDDVSFITATDTGGFAVTNTFNPNAHSLVEATSSSNTNQLGASAFASSVAAAYAGGMSGVVDFDGAEEELDIGPTVVADYGGSRNLAIGLTTGAYLDASPLAPTSGSTGAINCLSAPDDGINRGDITFTMGSISGGGANDKVVAFAFTFLTQTVLNGISVTVTATFSDNTTTAVTRTIDRHTSSPVKDIFFAFQAPSGKWITSVSLVSNTTRGETTHIDDLGFVTASIP